ETARRRITNRDDDVAGKDAGRRCRTAFGNGHRHQSGPVTCSILERIGHFDRLEPHTEPTARHVAVSRKLRPDARDGRVRNHQYLAARTEGRHADKRTACVENRPALLLAREADIERDAPVDYAAAAARPSRSSLADRAVAGPHATLSVR